MPWWSTMGVPVDVPHALTRVDPYDVGTSVGDKDGLHALMVDAVEGEIDVAEPSGDWRADLTATAHSYRAALIRHGWMTDFIGHRRALGPNELPHIERSLAALDGLGLTVHQRFNILMAVETYYLGFAIREQQELAVEKQNAGITAQQRRAFLEHEGARLRETGSYPQLSTLFESGGFVERNDRFAFGLERLLDGIEADVS